MMFVIVINISKYLRLTQLFRHPLYAVGRFCSSFLPAALWFDSLLFGYQDDLNVCNFHVIPPCLDTWIVCFWIYVLQTTLQTPSFSFQKWSCLASQTQFFSRSLSLPITVFSASSVSVQITHHSLPQTPLFQTPQLKQTYHNIQWRLAIHPCLKTLCPTPHHPHCGALHSLKQPSTPLMTR